ncbi:MAG: carboxylate--amine ligase [Candidatus Melainabacteria bacterium HGW-Melainabacteria-1]|nr:MAG: carboxylate--amine ligase [Candidatus Melainabacteria bacterium HGW-Melainabacteria-1]
MTKTETRPQTESHAQRETQSKSRGKIALLGYSIQSMEAARRLGYEFVSVVPEAYVAGLEREGLSAISWNFGKISQDSHKLYDALSAMGVENAIPLYEETVEWAGMLNSRLWDNPRIFNKYLLFRDKAMMKRKAQMSGLRVGVFEELDNKEQAFRFLARIQDVLQTGESGKPSPVHIKPTRAAGSVGHFAVRAREDVEKLPESMFPCMAESHLDGQEFSVEAFIHNGRIYFMNINQYIHLGYDQFSPPAQLLESQREKIRQAVEKLIKAFGIKYGVIHPEYFVDAEGELNFGEVAARVPGGSIFELIQRAYGFDPYEAMLLCADPHSSEQELLDFFPAENEPLGYAGNLLVYPQKAYVTDLNIPDELLNHPYFEKHNMFEPVTPKVAERVGFGNHYGTIFFFGDNPDEMANTLAHFSKVEFYT